MKKKFYPKLLFIMVCAILCCLFGDWSEKKFLEEKNSSSRLSSTATARATETEVTETPVSSPVPTFDVEEKVKVGCFEFIYNGAYEYFNGELYSEPNNFTLYKFQQEYDAEGNPIYTDIVIPDEIHGAPVIAVCWEVFKNHSEIQSIQLSENLLEINREAFYGCNGLEEIILPASLEEIGSDAFKKCTGLKEITIPENVQRMDTGAFAGCSSLEKVEMKGNPVEFYHDVFKNTKWIKDCKKKGVPAIADGILIDASGLSGHAKITGKKVNRIVRGAFQNANKITYLEIDGVHELSGPGGWISKSIQTIKVSRVERIGVSFFSNAYGLEKVIFGNGISQIPRCCFQGSPNIKTIIINSKKKIQWGTKHYEYEKWSYPRVFGYKADTKRLKDIYLYSSKVDSSIKKAKIPKNVILHVPASAISKYKKYVSCKVVVL